jgi:cytochrome b561
MSKERSMALTNSRDAYGWAAIALHWVSAAGIVVLYITGEGAEEGEERVAEAAANLQHVSIGALLFAFLAARILWSLSQPKPVPLEANRWLRLAAQWVQGLFLAMIAIQLVTGPLAVWAEGEPLRVFDWAALPSPFGGRVEWLGGAAGAIHSAAANLLWPLLGLHVLGAVKHLFIDRDATVRRMLWVSSR